jgi:hypothetical protein
MKETKRRARKGTGQKSEVVSAPSGSTFHFATMVLQGLCLEDTEFQLSRYSSEVSRMNSRSDVRKQFRPISRITPRSASWSPRGILSMSPLARVLLLALLEIQDSGGSRSCGIYSERRSQLLSSLSPVLRRFFSPQKQERVNPYLAPNNAHTQLLDPPSSSDHPASRSSVETRKGHPGQAYFQAPHSNHH